MSRKRCSVSEQFLCKDKSKADFRGTDDTEAIASTVLNIEDKKAWH
uniref:Uncharacterized protein n=1 Tax=Setaria digitata TaxID=48799 RepID=A0A915PXZ6_9BILA